MTRTLWHRQRFPSCRGRARCCDEQHTDARVHHRQHGHRKIHCLTLDHSQVEIDPVARLDSCPNTTPRPTRTVAPDSKQPGTSRSPPSRPVYPSQNASHSLPRHPLSARPSCCLLRQCPAGPRVLPLSQVGLGGGPRGLPGGVACTYRAAVHRGDPSLQ
jgi:hypothetical protein